MLLNSVEILAQSGLPTKSREVVGLAQQAGQALHALLNDILELSKLEAGRLSLRPAWFDIEALLAGVLDLFRLQTTGSGATFRLDLDPRGPGRIYTDPNRMRQIVMNFVSNAVKFSDPGEITIRARLDGETSRCLRIDVVDPGPKIAEADRERLFQAFSRLDHPGVQSKPGSGLGLAISRRLVELLGGDIGCDVSASGGNSFWLRLTIPAPASLPGDADDASNIRPLPVLPRTRVLLVDDVLANQTIAAMLLGRAGHAVDTVASGADAVAAASRKPYDIVLLDLFMPGMDGFATASRLRALEGPAGATPILALSANVDETARAACLAAGMQDLLGKPVDPRALLEEIHRLVWVPAPKAAARASPQPAPGPSTPVLCSDRLSLLREMLPDVALGRLFETCLGDLSDSARSLRDALAESDGPSAARELHAMVGVAASYGLAELEASLHALQTALSLGEPVELGFGLGRDRPRSHSRRRRRAGSVCVRTCWVTRALHHSA